MVVFILYLIGYLIATIVATKLSWEHAKIEFKLTVRDGGLTPSGEFFQMALLMVAWPMALPMVLIATLPAIVEGRTKSNPTAGLGGRINRFFDPDHFTR